ncbi:MAG: hypothetical protein GY950_24195, partial [bacterium]|nr:hypothetical protein [bacterium]
KVRFDKRGSYRLAHALDRFSKIDYIATLRFDAVGKSAEGKEYKAAASTVFFPGSRVTGINLSTYNTLDKPVTAELVMLDANGNFARGTTDITLYQTNYRAYRHKLEIIRTFKDVSVNKRKQFQFNIKEPGSYTLRCDTRDKNNRVISTSGSFGTWGHSFSDSHSLSIDTEKESYKVGDRVKLFINS